MAKKNQKYRKQNQRKNFPWLLAALGGGLLLLVAILFARNTGTGDGAPSIAIDQEKIDYGYVKFGETRQFAFKVTNMGDGFDGPSARWKHWDRIRRFYDA